MIDFVVFRSDHRRYSLVVQVMCGAICWTDHKLVRGKFRLYLNCSRHRQNRKESPIAVWKLADVSIREDYCRELSDRLEGVDLDEARSAEAGWEQLRNCLVASATKVAGCGHRRQPDWFLESEHLCWLLSVGPGTRCCMMILLPPIKGSGSVRESLSMLFMMLKKCGLRRRQKLPMLNGALC